MAKTRLPPIGFWSYVRADDEFAGHRISALKDLIEDELRLEIGEEARIFKDTVAIAHGARWEQQTTEALQQATFFIPILTPNFMRSEWCCREVKLFLQRQQELFETYTTLRQTSRIFPIHFADISDVDARDSEIRATLLGLQHLDLLKMRRRSFDDPEVERRVSEFIADICNLLREQVEIPGASNQLSPEEPKQAVRRPRTPRTRKPDFGFDVILVEDGGHRAAVVERVAALTGFGSREAAAILVAAPWPIAQGVSTATAESIKARIEDAGGQARLERRTVPAVGGARVMLPSSSIDMPSASPTVASSPLVGAEVIPVLPKIAAPAPPTRGRSFAVIAAGGLLLIFLLLLYFREASTNGAVNMIDNSAMDTTYDANMDMAISNTNAAAANSEAAATNAAEAAATNAAEAAANAASAAAADSTAQTGTIFVKNNCNTHLALYLSYRDARRHGWRDGNNWGINSNYSEIEDERVNGRWVPIRVETGEFFYYARSADGSVQVRGDTNYTFDGEGGGTFPARHVLLSPDSSGQYVIDLNC